MMAQRWFGICYVWLQLSLHRKHIDPRMGPTIKRTRDDTGQMGLGVHLDMVYMDYVNKNYYVQAYMLPVRGGNGYGTGNWVGQ